MERLAHEGTQSSEDVQGGKGKRALNKSDLFKPFRHGIASMQFSCNFVFRVVSI